jgi:alginate O-acetyltransferase complex protein AlgI
MHFVSLAFLGFCAVVFAVYRALPGHRARMVWLLLASCVYYMSWHPWLIVLVATSASTDYFAALALESLTTPRWRKFVLVGSISVNLGLLAFFKYANFLLATTCSFLAFFGRPTDPFLLKVVLPLGISFYTFETISYVTDVYRGRLRAVRNPLDYALFMMFFPHLMAGPIVRPNDFLPQLGRRKRFSWDRLALGVRLFLLGLFKKAVIADSLAATVDPVFAAPGGYSTAAVWLAAIGYAFQIYCDFSGYSDMACGLAHALGFKLPVNFRQPYLAGNVSEFWHRWHISLSTWLRDYLFIPLGGNRGGPRRTCANLMVTMLLGGLWHGANWTFVFWGFYHGVLLVLHRVCRLPEWLSGRAARPLWTALTFLSVCVGWVFFRAQSFADAGMMLLRMAWPTAGTDLGAKAGLLVAACAAATLTADVASRWPVLRKWNGRLPAPLVGAATAGLLVAYILLLPDERRGFLYFQF